MFSFFRRSAPSESPSAAPMQHWHHPSAVPAAPILITRPAELSEARVHWWNEDTTHVAGDAISTVAPYHLPACGFFEPSASFRSAQSDDIPWITLTGPSDSINDISALTSVVIAGPPRRRQAPLKRVRTINREAGEAIRKKRKIEKDISPAELLRGLGMTLSSRPSPASAKRERRKKRRLTLHKVENWLTTMNDTLNLDSYSY
ncbi:hypothetical protein DXG03_006311 [Asterophora parasitica]|uniref:Uncharacterized protein n=1 Tax=Asterophora parasitica TaxID=117018 RepID=A0A9P7G5T2_9AGAR|nr:hypothetical protein DXG03_006311 [Asterophora parasitica]